VTVESIRLRLLLVAPLRLVLSVVLLVAARAAGATGGAYLVFVVGVLASMFLVTNDPRARFRRAADPEPLPADARVAPAWAHAMHAALPSTAGVAILAAVTVAFKPTLAAFLAGILAGLGGAAVLVLLRGIDPQLYVEPSKGALFRK
jgi:hypothetical protein